MTLKWKIAQYVELRWWEKYLAKKPKAEYLQWKQAYWQDTLQKIHLITGCYPEGKVLDAGCGPAGIFMNMADCEVDAIDPLLASYETSLKHFDKADYPNVLFKAISLEELKEREQYDWVFCMNAINHVADIDVSIVNLYASLKKGGYMVVSIDAHRYNSLKWLFRAIPGDILHPHQLNLGDYLRLILATGMKHNGTTCTKHGNIFHHYLLVFRKM